MSVLFLGVGALAWWLQKRGEAPTTGGPSSGPSISSGAAAPAASATPGGLARVALAGIAVRPKEPLTGYSRTAFGATWGDPDGNGCDTRNDILQRDLSEVVLRAGSDCLVDRGVLTDPYTGRRAAFQRGTATSGLVNIDHVVPLGNAWRSGASHWDPALRRQFYNDPGELLAVFEATNAAKNGSDAAAWLPPQVGLRCGYVARVVAVKSKYGLSMTQAEHDAIERVLAACPDQRTP